MIASTGQVERGFSTRTAALDAHLGQRTRADKTPDNAEIFTEIGLDGPDDESGLFSRTIFGDYNLTPLAKECAELWMSSCKEVRRLHAAEGCRDETPASSRHRFGGAAFANMGTRQYCGQEEKVWLAGITWDEIREMKKRAEKTPVPQTKAMKDFLETTKQR